MDDYQVVIAGTKMNTTAKIDTTLNEDWLTLELRETELAWTWFRADDGSSTYVSGAHQWAAIETARKAWRMNCITFENLPTVSIERACAIMTENASWDWQNEDRPAQSFGPMEQDAANQTLESQNATQA